MAQKTRSLKAIIFDLDGTLIDTVGIHAASWVIAFEANGYKVGINEVEPLIGMAGKRIVKKLLDKEGFRRLSSITSCKNRVYLEMVEEARLFPRVQETLCMLSGADLRLALATSTLSHVLSRVLERFCLAEFFDTIVAGDEVTRGKPSPEIFMRVFERLGLDPHLGAVVGDTEYDILPAIRTGATSIMITHGRRRELAVRPDYVIDELPDLLRILEDLNAHYKIS
jgi:HAD superfamily hydrolase (TIGR01509 family)